MNANAEKVLYVIRSGPYSNAIGVEALDAIMIGASFELDVSVLFLSDGVFQLKKDQKTLVKDQNGEAPSLKQFTKAYRALSDFGVDSLYIQDLSLATRGLSASDLMVPVTIIDSPSVAQLIAEQSRVFTF